MNLAVSNICWDSTFDSIVYDSMEEYGFNGLEIAPTRIFPNNPYLHCDEASSWQKQIESTYGFCIPSIQSIWFGRPERLFGSVEERQYLLQYTKLAIDFAQALKCHNLVFGCPRNRSITEGYDEEAAISFFREIGEYALLHNTVIGMEANPTIYNTNFINRTTDAIDFVEKVNSRGFRINLDLGTMIYYDESPEIFRGKEALINHIHISEPGLVPIKERDIHLMVRNITRLDYAGFISIEMSSHSEIDVLQKCMRYVSRVFK